MNAATTYLAGSLMVCTCACTPSAVPPPSPSPVSRPSDDPRETVEYLVSLRHGPRRTTERGRVLFRRIEENPEHYVEAVRQLLVLPDDIATLGEWLEPASRRPARALILATALGKEHGGATVLPFLRETGQRIAELEESIEDDRASGRAIKKRLETSLWTARLLRIAALTAMTDLKDPAAIDDVLRTIERTGDNGSRSMMLRYLEAVACGSNKVGATLREMVEDPASPLHDDPDARRALDHISNNSAGRAVEDGDGKGKRETGKK